MQDDLGRELRDAGLVLVEVGNGVPIDVYAAQRRSHRKAHDEAAGRRVARRPMKELDVQLRAGQLQGVGVIDLGVVDVQLP